MSDIVDYADQNLSPDERLIWLLGDMMNAAENYFGAENPKRLGHINCAAARIIDDIVAPLRTALAEKTEGIDQAIAIGQHWERCCQVASTALAEAERERDGLRERMAVLERDRAEHIETIIRNRVRIEELKNGCQYQALRAKHSGEDVAEANIRTERAEADLAATQAKIRELEEGT